MISHKENNFFVALLLIDKNIISYFFSIPKIESKSIFITETAMARIAAAKNPLVLNPLIQLSTNKIINTVMINEIKPSVKIFSGKVKMRNINPIVAFAMAINSAAITALRKPSTWTPGMM